MSLNLRYGTAPDGPNSWEHRRAAVMSFLERTTPDVLCTQEALRFQIDEILLANPRFVSVGLGRDDGRAAGEHCAVFVDRSLTVLEKGTFWFSDRPFMPGSNDWGNRLPRICTWVRLAEPALTIYNLHLDHEHQGSRLKSIRLIRSRAVNPCVVTGDFNMEPDNPALSLLSGFQDVMAGSTEPTFHGWDSLQSRIDYIFASPDVSFADANIHPEVISDHFAISASVTPMPSEAR